MEDNKLNNFLIKLWTILEDESISNTICWDRTGDSFHVYDVYRFCEEVSPRFFNFKSMASFVRQLNLYGFKKIATVDRSVLHNDNNTEPMQFAHPFFRYGHPHLLKKIKRNQVAIKRRASRQDVQLLDAEQSQNTTLPYRQEQQNMVTLPEYDLNYLLEELQQFRIKTADMQNTIVDLTNDNQLLWNEVSLLRDSHLRQQQNVSNLVEFLMSILQDNVNVRSQKQGKINCARQIVPLQGPKSPLAVARFSSASNNQDVLLNIRENILSEALNYSNNSALTPHIYDEMQPISTTAENPKMQQSIIEQQQESPSFSENQKNGLYNTGDCFYNDASIAEPSSKAEFFSQDVFHDRIEEQDRNDQMLDDINLVINKEQNFFDYQPSSISSVVVDNRHNFSLFEDTNEFVK